jgi:uncharacterized Fe-S cluster-containing protein
MPATTEVKLPGLDCGLCGFKHCEELERELLLRPELLKRCIQVSDDRVSASAGTNGTSGTAPTAPTLVNPAVGIRPRSSKLPPFVDTLGRDFDFYLEHFPEDPGPREIIIPHNPMITRELPVQKGDILIGRPLGMSCGCPITHCGIAMEVDQRTGVIVWCVTGPLAPRAQGFKDLGYYIAEGYEGLITETKSEVKIGCRYYFQPRMCMLQWRHSGLVNFMNRTPSGIQVRVEGLWIG